MSEDARQTVDQGAVREIEMRRREREDPRCWRAAWRLGFRANLNAPGGAEEPSPSAVGPSALVTS